MNELLRLVHNASVKNWETTGKRDVAIYVNRDIYRDMLKFEYNPPVISSIDITVNRDTRDITFDGFPVYEVVTPSHPPYRILPL